MMHRLATIHNVTDDDRQTTTDATVYQYRDRIRSANNYGTFSSLVD